MTSPRTVVDVTLLLRDPRLVGISRVVLVVVEELLAAADPDVAFSRFDPVYARFERVDPDTLRDVSDVMHRAGAEVTPTPSAAPRSSRGRATVDHFLERRPATRQTTDRLGYYARHAITETAKIPGAILSDRHRRADPCFSLEWDHSTVYCTLAFDHLDGSFEHLARQRSVRGFSTVLTVHDLTPIITPQYHGGHGAAETPESFRSAYLHLLRSSDRLLSISESTRHDLMAFAAAEDLPIPPISLLPLGAALPVEPPLRPAALPAAATGEGAGFALTVGTVEIRKNHDLLLDVWEMMLRDRPRETVPHLVVVGRPGWLAHETLDRMTRTPAFAGVVHHLPGLSDPELAWCYQHAAFTLYPSLYEGWGLPISESLATGTPCLTSDTSSLPEVGQGLTDLLDPYDRVAWRDRILELWTRPDLRAERCDRIAREFHNPTRRDTRDAALAAIEAARSATG